jgi:hypothetical protein
VGFLPDASVMLDYSSKMQTMQKRLFEFLLHIKPNLEIGIKNRDPERLTSLSSASRVPSDLAWEGNHGRIAIIHGDHKR